MRTVSRGDNMGDRAMGDLLAGMDDFMSPLDRLIIRTVAASPYLSVDGVIDSITGEIANLSSDEILIRIRELTNEKDAGRRAAYIRCGTHEGCVGNTYGCGLVVSEIGQAMINRWEDTRPEGFVKPEVIVEPDGPPSRAEGDGVVIHEG